MFDKVSYWTDWTAFGLMPPFNGSEQRKYIRGSQGSHGNIYYITYSKAAAKLLFLYFLDDGVYFNDTTCSPSAFKRGPGQKIVAFSIYGNLSSIKSRERG